MATYKPILNNILIFPVQEEEEIIAVPATNEPIKASVIEVGKGDNTIPLQVHPGMFVWFNKRDARPIKIEGELHYILNQKDILLVEED